MAFSALCMTCHSPFPDPKNWNKAIKKQVQDGKLEEAFSLFANMQERGFHPDNFTFPILLEATGRHNALNNLGFVLHGQAMKTGYSDHLFVQTSLLNLYSNLKDINKARKVFEKMPVKDVIAWNSMLDAYASQNQMEYATALFDSMPEKGLTSYNIMISGYAKTKQLELARSFFKSAHTRDIASWNSMILACTLTGHMEEAQRLFNQAPNKNIVTWNTMVSGYLHNELYSKVLELFDRMKAENFKPDHLTLSGVLAASAHLGSLEIGRAIHIYALENQLMCPEVITSLIDLYAKCGSITHSLEVFYKSQAKDIFCWNAILSGLALNGHGRAALELFDLMKLDKSLNPDDITFIALLSACSHSGYVKEGCSLFSSMKDDYGISPKLEHYGCMIDLLGRANLLSQALELVDSMPFKPGESILGALLSACVIHQDLEVGEKVVRLVIEKGEQDNMSDGEFMMVSNLYAACGEWEEAAKWREKMNEEGIVKTAGCSVIELNGKSHKFLAGGLSVL